MGNRILHDHPGLEKKYGLVGHKIVDQKDWDYIYKNMGKILKFLKKEEQKDKRRFFSIYYGVLTSKGKSYDGSSDVVTDGSYFNVIEFKNQLEEINKEKIDKFIIKNIIELKKEDWEDLWREEEVEEIKKEVIEEKNTDSVYVCSKCGARYLIREGEEIHICTQSFKGRTSGGCFGELVKDEELTEQHREHKKKNYE